MSQQEDPRNVIRQILVKAKDQMTNGLSFYRDLEQSIPETEIWKIERVSPLLSDYEGMMGRPMVRPSSIFMTAISVIDEYLTSLDLFTNDQVSAFFLGLGLRWIELPYWGMSSLQEQRQRIELGIEYWEKLESELPEADKWRIMKQIGVFTPTDLIPKRTAMPSELLHDLLDLVKAQIAALDQWTLV